MSAAPEIQLVIDGLGLGGTQRGLVAHAVRLQRYGFAPRVVCVDELGPRARELEEAGVDVACAAGDTDRLASLLDGARLVHGWRASPADRRIPRAARRAGAARLVETSIFGLSDASRDAASPDCRLFLSRSCAVRYRRRGGMPLREFHAVNRVLPLPLEAERLRDLAPPSQEAKRRLGLAPERPVVGRIGRADDFKWRELIVRMLPELWRRVPEAQVLLVGATAAKRRLLRRQGLLDRCLLVDPVAGDAELAALYAACDVFMSAAEIGESQGLAIAEAMALEIPVVSCSTPWVDNAQAEYVLQGMTGYLAGHPVSFAEAVAALLADTGLQRRFGERGRELVESMLDPDVLTARLASLYAALLSGGAPPAEWQPDAEELAEFERSLPERSGAEFRPLGRRERAQVRLARERERARRVRGLLRPARLPLAAALVRSRLAELWR